LGVDVYLIRISCSFPAFWGFCKVGLCKTVLITKGPETLNRYLTSCINARDKLSKFLSRVDRSDSVAESSLAPKKIKTYYVLASVSIPFFSPLNDIFVIQTQPREAKKMDKTIQTLGSLYDDLAKYAADLKVSPDFSKILAGNINISSTLALPSI